MNDVAKVNLVRFGVFRNKNFVCIKNENQLRKYFLEFGAISEVEVQADKGQAFITFDDHDSVDRAVSTKHTVSTTSFSYHFCARGNGDDFRTISSSKIIHNG